MNFDLVSVTNIKFSPDSRSERQSISPLEGEPTKATGVEDYYSIKQIHTVIKLHFYTLLFQFLMKIIMVINPVRIYVKTSA